MPLYRRLARRGFSNYPFKKIWEIVNLGQIEQKYAEGETVDSSSLIKKGLVKKAGLIKVLGEGKLTKKLKFKIEALSASAREKITAAGGEVPPAAEPKAAAKPGAKAPAKEPAEPKAAAPKAAAESEPGKEG
jgi:large subunit ribosomal protein L15